MIPLAISSLKRRSTHVAVAILGSLLILIATATTRAQCPVTDIPAGLQAPLGATLSKKGNLLVSETGTNTPNSGRVSIVSLAGVRRTLIDGLPSGLSAEGNEPSGPGGVFLRDRTLYVAIGVGDNVIAGPVQGSEQPNPTPSSPLLSSVLAIHFSAAVEAITQGFTLAITDHATLANHQPVTLNNGAGEHITVELVANLPSYTPDPRPDFPGNVRNSNPFDVVAVGNRLYVSDGGQNAVWRVDLTNGSFAVLAAFPPVANPLPFGPPVVDAVPTGIVFADGKLLVTLFRGFPFAPGSSTVETIDLQTGSHTPFISGLKTAIDVLPIHADEDLTSATRYLVLEHSSGDILTGPGRLLRYNQPDATPQVIADCLPVPTSMALDSSTGKLYLTELSGHLAMVDVAAEAHDSAAGVQPSLLNISARGLVQTGDNILIGGFIAGEGTSGSASRLLVRAMGPSLGGLGVTGALSDPVLELHDASGAIIATNDNWKDAQQAEIEATGLSPSNAMESAIVRSFAAGNYTAIVRGKNNATGVALVEVYSLD